MAPAGTTTATAAGASSRLVAHHADRGGALPQLRYPSRCHGASGPGQSPSGLQGPVLRGLSEAFPRPGQAGQGGGHCSLLASELPGAPAASSGWALLWEWRLRRPQGERGPRVPGASASLGQPFLPVAFSVSASSASRSFSPESCLLNFSEVFLLSSGVQTLRRLDRKFSRGQKIVFVELQKSAANFRKSALGDKSVGEEKKEEGPSVQSLPRAPDFMSSGHDLSPYHPPGRGVGRWSYETEERRSTGMCF